MPTFRCTCEWAGSSNVLPLSHFEDVYKDDLEAIRKIRNAKLGDVIEIHQPFNGWERFERIT
jgi:hypothetical protein